MARSEMVAGTGVVLDSNHQQKVVYYRLYLDQEQISTPPARKSPRRNTIRGVVQPVCFFDDTNLTLQMQDGRKVKFFFTDSAGSIVATFE